MADGFEVNDRFYKMPESFRMGDPILVEEVTGLTWPEFSDRLEEPEGDPAVMLGMLAVAVWQGNDRWRREKVARFVEALSIEDVKFIAEETDARPPDEDGSSAKDDGSASRSSGQADTSSEDVSPGSTTPAGSQPTTPVSA